MALLEIRRGSTGPGGERALASDAYGGEIVSVSGSVDGGICRLTFSTIGDAAL